MTQREVLQVGSRLFKHLGSPGGQMAIYPKQEGDGSWFLLVKYSQDLAFSDLPDEFEGLEVRYETYDAGRLRR